MWVRFFGAVPPDSPESVANLLERAGIDLTFPTGAVEGFGAAVFEQVDDALLDELRTCAAGSAVLAVCIGRRPSLAQQWALSRAGAKDVLVWSRLPDAADQVAS